MSRDTQFQGFAKLLFGELQAIEVEGLKNNWNNLDVYRRQREAIARRAYDLVAHTLGHAPMTEWTCGPSDIPDITEVIDEQQ